MNENDDLEQWQKQWQATHHDLDAEKLIQHAHQRNLRERTVSILEVLLGLVAIGFCLEALFSPAPSVVERGIFFTLALFVVAFLAWAMHQRRLIWLQYKQDASSLIALEHQRLNRKLRYWRVSFWCVFALWLFSLAMAGLSIVGAVESGREWLMAAAGNLIVLLTTGVWTRIVKIRVSEHHRQLDSLFAQLGESDAG